MIKLTRMPLVALSNEEVVGTTYTYSTGFGQLTKAGATVQKGATVTATVDITMKVVTNEQTNSWYNENKHVYSTETQHEIESHLSESNTSSAWWAIFAHGASGNHNKDEWEHDNTLVVNTTDDQQTNIVKSMNKLESKDVNIKGNISITGYSYLPTTAFIFAQISTITFSDGTTAQVINGADPVAADTKGDTSTVKADPGQKLNIIPIK